MSPTDVFWTTQRPGSETAGNVDYVTIDGRDAGTLALEWSNTLAGVAWDNAGVVYFTDGVWIFGRRTNGMGGGYMDRGTLGVAIDNARRMLFVSDATGLESLALATQNPLTPWITSTGSSWGVATDGARVFQADTNSGTVVACAETAPCGNAPQVIATGLASLWAIASDGTNVWFTTLGTSSSNYGDGAIYRCSVTGTCGSPPSPFISNQPKPTAVVTDGSSVYWGSALGGISKCPVVGCPDGGPTVISTDAVTSMTQDAMALYYTSPSGFVGKLAK